MATLHDWTGDIHWGDAVETMLAMPESSVHCVITSPPYWRMRDYDVEGQLGLEDTLAEYIHALVEVGAAVRHVLRPDGNWFLNLGDTFAGSQNGRSFDGDNNRETSLPAARPAPGTANIRYREKTKLLIPDRVAIALTDTGWVVRGDYIWAKTNGVPDPVKDRFREDKEHLFHLTPNPQYWFDLDAVRVPHAQASIERSGRHDHTTRDHPSSEQTLDPDQFVHPNGANPGDILEGPVAQYPDAHFSTFPEWLVETPCKAAVPPAVCAECARPFERTAAETPLWERDIDDVEREQSRAALQKFRESYLSVAHLEAISSVGFGDVGHGEAAQGSMNRVPPRTQDLANEAKDVLGGYFREFCQSAKRETDGWEQACSCPTAGEYSEPGIVLDPFVGSGTTCAVAKRLGRRFVGIDLHPEFVAMAQKRVGVTVDEPWRLSDDSQQTVAEYTVQED